jgi:hypothetical protein
MPFLAECPCCGKVVRRRAKQAEPKP